MPAPPRRGRRSCIACARPSSAGSTIADLTPARVADAEGISERYLQKLFEGSGSSFTHYVRERRLQRASAELSSPAEAHHSISEIAYRNGFNDSAHFSRAFRHRFGLSPREFRQQELERASASAVTGQRGWPQQALAQLRSHYPLAGAERSAEPAPADKATCCTEGEQRHHHLCGGSRPRALGIFLPLDAAADRDQFRRDHHDRNPDAACLRRSRADDQGRCRRRKRVPLDARGEERRPARRRADGCVRLRPRRRRRLRGSHLHRTGGREGRAARRRAGGAHPRHRAAPLAQSRFRGPGVRLQRRGVVGLSLQRTARRAEPARGRDDLRDIRPR